MIGTVPDHMKLISVAGSCSLTFTCGNLPADPAVFAAGHEPNGHFREGAAEYLVGGARGDRAVLGQLRVLRLPRLDLGPYLETLGNVNHIAISVTRDLRGKLDAAGVEYHTASGTSIYFKDPDGVRLELLGDPFGEMYGTKVL